MRGKERGGEEGVWAFGKGKKRPLAICHWGGALPRSVRYFNDFDIW